MANYKFNFSKFGKPRVKSTNSSPRREIVAKNIIGVIGIKLDGSYYIVTKDKEYLLTIESYELKGKNVYYARTLQNNRILNVISLSKKLVNNKQYLPFGVGSIVKGNVYKILGTERFNIGKILEAKDVPEEYQYFVRNTVHNNKQFFRDNYEEIEKCITN